MQWLWNLCPQGLSRLELWSNISSRQTAQMFESYKSLVRETQENKTKISWIRISSKPPDPRERVVAGRTSVGGTEPSARQPRKFFFNFRVYLSSKRISKVLYQVGQLLWFRLTWSEIAGTLIPLSFPWIIRRNVLVSVFWHHPIIYAARTIYKNSSLITDK